MYVSVYIYIFFFMHLFSLNVWVFEINLFCIAKFENMSNRYIQFTCCHIGIENHINVVWMQLVLIISPTHLLKNTWNSSQFLSLGWSQGATMNCWAQQCQRVPLWMLQPMAPRRNNEDFNFEVDWGWHFCSLMWKMAWGCQSHKVTQWRQVAFRIALPETSIAI